MSLTSVYRRALVGAVVCGVAASGVASAQAILPPSLELRVPKAPTLGTAEGGSFLAYELHITNFSGQPMTLKSVEVLSGSADKRVLFTLADSALTQGIARPGLTIPAGDRSKIAGGTRAVVFVWMPVDVRSAPTSLRNRVKVEQGSGDSTRTQELEGALVSVGRMGGDIGPPLRGGVWLAANGPSVSSGHRRALIPISGSPSIAQRFAIDWVRVNATDSTYSGDRLQNENYIAEGNDAIAVANGRVVAVKDGIPENVPGVNSRAVPITLETVGGNHVIIDIGGGRFAFYAHLKPGAIRVKVGESVKKGQVIGLVGNTGNSTEPHLHFHISDANSPLGSEGVPYGLDSFEIVGHCRAFNTSCTRETPQTRRGEIPLENVLVRFP
ncbi:MAG: M23 family metallopeptidase [Gemmatimonadaceae bacterium]